MHGVRIDFANEEMNELRYPSNPEMVPLDVRIHRYIESLEQKSWRESPLTVGLGPDLRGPLKFFGSYVKLNALDKTFIAENEVLQYYKCIIKDI